MIRALRPSAGEIAAALERFGASSFSYPEVGATADPAALDALADRYRIDRRRFPLGRGRERFERARTALFAWRQFEIPWLALEGAERPAHAGQTVATLTRIGGLWFLNPCRVVDCEAGTDAAREVAFAYGTLADHVAAGEERFTLRWDPTTDEVAFEILAFSRPAKWLTRLGRPFMRHVQRRFASAAAEALANASGPPGAGSGSHP